MKKAIMYGAGNIGRGFIGQLFYESGFSVGFIDVNMTVIDRLNADKRYPVYITNGDSYMETFVENVYGVDGRNNDLIAEEIASAEIMATAVGVKILKFIAAPIACGIKLRKAKGIEAPLNIIVCENMIDADKYLEELIKSSLNEDESRWFDEHIGLVEPSIGRMVPAAPAELTAKEPLAVCVEPYCELPVNAAAIKGELPAILNIKPFAPFDFYIRRKLFLHNMGHAVTAYLGKKKGYTALWEAAEDKEIAAVAHEALAEASAALSAEYGVAIEELNAFCDELQVRFCNKLLGDTCDRVGRDTQRKLSANDRLVGAAMLCKKHGIEPTAICKGIDAALDFAPADDEPSVAIAKLAKEQGKRAALASLVGEDIAAQLI